MTINNNEIPAYRKEHFNKMNYMICHHFRPALHEPKLYFVFIVKNVNIVESGKYLKQFSKA